MKEKISIVIPTYNHCEDLLKPCVESIINKTQTEQYEINLIIVANGCIDNTKEYINELKNRNLSINIFDIFEENPLGYTKAANLGIEFSRKLDSDYTILSNNDIILLDFGPVNLWIEMILKPFKDDQNVMITGPSKVINETLNLPFVIFFFVAIRNSIFDKIGTLDENFNPGFNEDVDFCARVLQEGYKIIRVPNDGSDFEYSTGFPIYHVAEKTVHDNESKLKTVFGLTWDEIKDRNNKYLKEKYNLQYSIIIPTTGNYKNKLDKCLDSMFKTFSDTRKLEVIVVANGVDSETEVYLHSRSDIKTIFEKDAIGYIKATNLGLSQVKGNYVILLNDDVEFPEQEKNDWLNRLKKPFLLDDKMGITGIKLLGSFFSQAEYLMFFCVMIKKEMIDKIGLLDENLVPAFVEDEEYCVRARLNGYNIADANNEKYTNSMLALWHPSSTTYNNFKENKIQIKKNRYYLLNKYFPNRCVNIIVPTYKRYSELSEALRTINNQTFDCIKTWVCSDGHDPEVEKIVDQFEKNSEHKQFNYLFLPEHEGLIGSKPRMFALDHIDNKGVVCFLDDDNVLYPTYVEKLFNAIRNDGNFKNDETFIANSNIISYCRIKHSHFPNPVPDENHVAGKFEKGQIDSLNFMVNSYIAKLCKNKWQHIKGNEITHDFDFISECSKFGKSVFVDEVLAEHKMSKNKINGCNIEDSSVDLNQNEILASLVNDITLTSYDEAKQENRITIAYIHHNSEHLELFLQPSLDKLINRNFDLIILDDKDCPACNYNKIIEQSKNDFILFVHEDVMFSADFLDRIWDTIFKYPNFGVLGFEGANHSKDLKQMQSYVWANKENSAVLTTIDAAAFVINKKHNLKFDDKTFNDFHLFVEDYCLQATRKLNLECRTVLINAFESHLEPHLYENSFYIHKAQTCHSLGYNWGRFIEFFQKLIEKWQVEKKQKIYDCFQFYNELDVLEIRLNELYEVVDKFVLVEATFTHSGKPKPLYFNENKQRFSKFLDKIEHIIVREQPEENSLYIQNQQNKQYFAERNWHWIRERYQRDMIVNGLKNCNENDIIIISDVDEIVSAEAVKSYNISMGYCALNQRLFYYKINCEVFVNWPKARIMPYSFLIDIYPSDVRCELDGAVQSSINNGGWHFSYLYSTNEGVRDKIQSFCHQELNNPETIDLDRLNDVIENAKDVYGRDHAMRYIEIDSSFPKFIYNNQQYFLEKNLIKKIKTLDHSLLKQLNQFVYDEIFAINVYGAEKQEIKDSIVVDIGANYGFFALKAKQLEANKVYCFEPLEENFKVLKQLTENDSSIKIFKLAVFDGSCSSIRMHSDNISSNIWGKENGEEVKCVSFVEAFSYLENKENKPLVLKLDCEGSEFEIIFQTPIDILRKFETIYLETHDKVNPKFIDRTQDLLNYLKFVGFEVVSQGPPYGTWYPDGSFIPIPIYTFKLKRNKEIKNEILPTQRVYDCFMFNDELDILDIRFQELNDVVDYFVIVESPITHSGKPKPLYFQENEKRYEKYLHKIRHYVYNPPQTDNPWVRENAQREALKDGLFDCNDYDIIISGDADEIPRKEIIKNFNIIKGPISVETKYFFYFLNCLRQEKGTTHLRIVPFWLIKFYGFCFFRYAKFNLIKNGGWHFSFIGDVKQIKKKFDSYAHQEYNNEYYTDENRLINMINNGEDILEKGMIFKFIEVDDDFPEFIKENKQNFIDRNLIKT